MKQEYFVVLGNTILYNGGSVAYASRLAVKRDAAFLVVDKGTTLEDIILAYKESLYEGGQE